MEEYKFDGNAYDFLWLMKWSLVARQMLKENRKGHFSILTDSEKVQEAAEEYGMDDFVLINELIRLTDELKNTEFYANRSLIEELLRIAEANEENGV